MRITRMMAGIALALSMPAWGQIYAGQNNALDANRRVGSGGYNPSMANDYRINSGNRFISGNVTGGQAFRGYSPIRDASSLFLGSPRNNGAIGSGTLGNSFGGLPSDRLSAFRRDSYGLTNGVAAPSLAGRPLPYYSPSSTVTNTGQIIRGYNQPGTSQTRSDYVPLQSAYGAPMQSFTAVQRNTLVTPRENPLNDADNALAGPTTLAGKTATGAVNPRLLASPLFGGLRQTPTGIDPSAINPAAQLDLRRGAQPNESANEKPLPNPGNAMAGQPGQTDGSLAASEGSLRREAGTHAGQGAAQGTLATPTGAPDAARSVAPTAVSPAWRQQVSDNMPLSTFVGTQEGRLAEQMAAGEQMLHDGRYYDAARHYEMAHAIDLANPLPLLGRSMSLLAAGDYVSSANDLLTAVQQTDGRTAVNVNLTRFIPDLSILDRRRAYLEQRLELVDDFRLRFLLGWAEYMSDLHSNGLANMEKAAKAAPPQASVLRQFVQTLVVQPPRPSTQPARK